MLTISEYEKIAIKMCGVCGLHNPCDEEIGTIINYMMVADNRYNEKIGNRNGFRGSYARFAVKKCKSIRKKSNINLTTNDFELPLLFTSSDDPNLFVSKDNVINNIVLNNLVDFLIKNEKEYFELKKTLIDGLTLEEVGKLTNVSKERARQRRETQISKIRENFKI